MKRSILALSFVALLSLTATRPIDQETLLGFTAASSRLQEEAEDRFDAMLNQDNLRNWMEHMTARPQHVGSPQGKENAEFVAKLLESWGYDVEIEVFQVLFPTPRELFVELTAPSRYASA
jgi:N-acetylated-alpha-linked acidic dipeptidase